MESHCLRLGVVPLVPGGGPHRHVGRHVAAQAAADDLGEDLVDEEHGEGAHQHHPAQRQQHEGEHEERLVAVGVRGRVRELDLEWCNG